MSAPSVISQATTEHIAPAERIHYWEDYNRKALVALSCTSYSEQGLLARQTNIELGELRLAEISGNAHAIERSPQTVRSAPKDSVFATLLLKGEAVFLHEHGCLAATAGELFVYDTRRPYLFGFSSSMRQILVDVPRDLFTQACGGGGVPGPMLFGRGTAREGALVTAADNTNQRTDRYGGSVENRIRFAVEVAAAVAEEIGADRTGLRISPGNSYNDIAESDTDELYPALLRALSPLGLAYLHVMHVGDEELLGTLRELWPTTLILNRAGTDLPTRAQDVHTGTADLVSVGALALANPDLVERLRSDAPLNTPDPATFYGGGVAGYTDYPTHTV